MGVDSVGSSNSNRGSSGTSSSGNTSGSTPSKGETNTVAASKPATPEVKARVTFNQSSFAPPIPRSSLRPELDPKPLAQRAELTAVTPGPNLLQGNAMGPRTSFQPNAVDSTGHLKPVGLSATSFQPLPANVPLPRPRPEHISQLPAQAPIPQTRPANLAPRPTVAAAATPGITLGTDVVPSAFSTHSAQVVKDIMNTAGVTDLRISSTARTPESQAAAMYTNIENKGVSSQLRLYGAGGDAVVNAYVTARDAGLSKGEILQAMTDKINELGPSSVSRHAASPEQIARLNIIDIAPSSIPKSQHDAFVEAIQAHPGVSTFLGPADGDPAFHLEIPQPQ